MVSNAPYSIGEPYGAEIGTVAEREISDLCHAVRNDIFGKFPPARNMNERFAVGSEKAAVDAFKVRVSRRNTELFQVAARDECLGSYLHHTIGERHRFERIFFAEWIFAEEKRPITDPRHAVWDLKRFRSACVFRDRDGIAGDLIFEPQVFQRVFQFLAENFPTCRLRLDCVFCQSAERE